MRWPVDADRRTSLRHSGQPRLLLVEHGADPPVSDDCIEDWIRVPAPEADVRARTLGLTARSASHAPASPTFDDGVLRYAGRWVGVPPVEARLLEPMVGQYGRLVARDALVRAAWADSSPRRNALDVHVLRLRRRLGPVGLAIRTVRSRGYVLEALEERAAADA